MTEQQFNDAWSNYELEADYAQFVSDNYPNRVTYEDFAEYMITK